MGSAAQDPGWLGNGPTLYVDAVQRTEPGVEAQGARLGAEAQDPCEAFRNYKGSQQQPRGRSLPRH